MSAISSLFGGVPGIGAVTETHEAAITWGPAWNLRWISAQITSAAIDSGNSPTWRLRPGLVMGVISATQLWTNYSASATDGSQIARGILAYGMRMQDVLSGSNVNKFYAMVIGGQIRGANLVGLDLLAREQLSRHFMFDDSVIGTHGVLNVPVRQITKTADYTAVTADNGTLFDNAGASATVNITLPTLAVGLAMGISVVADQTLTITSAAGNDIVAFNDASASSLSFGTSSAKVGGQLWLMANPAGTKWLVQNRSAGANTVTIV